eukprot:TRINITY_DN22727_c0_g1_i1.p1 TRINITY_DN22727_c0_g1~~TRINITY_DN22727_c0_g1_i1.p1  ORF type:complete len:295 (-),score=94.58 TRINITY_DN22727_c0_g1_i1:158-943(-)
MTIQNAGGEQIGQAAHNSLLLIGAHEPRAFLQCLGGEIQRVGLPSSGAEPPAAGSGSGSVNAPIAIQTIGSLVRKQPASMVSILPRLVETVVKSLDPHTPPLRDSCLKAATAVLHVLVKKYPMVSFHQESQRLAVGTHENHIIIYDLKTATRWHVLEGHKASVSAVSFNETGKFLASYSVIEGVVRIWQTGTGFFGFGGQPQTIKTYSVPRPDKPITVQMYLESVVLQWPSPSTLTLFRGWDTQLVFQLNETSSSSFSINH